MQILLVRVIHITDTPPGHAYGTCTLWWEKGVVGLRGGLTPRTLPMRVHLHVYLRNHFLHALVAWGKGCDTGDASTHQRGASREIAAGTPRSSLLGACLRG